MTSKQVSAALYIDHQVIANETNWIPLSNFLAYKSFRWFSQYAISWGDPLRAENSTALSRLDKRQSGELNRLMPAP
jgi:hypothetical protein